MNYLKSLPGLETSKSGDFIKKLNFIYSDNCYQDLLQSMWEEYIVSDTYCEQDKNKRHNQVHNYNQVKDILLELGEIIGVREGA